MIKFIISNWITVLYVILALCGIGYLIYKRQWDTLRRVTYNIILDAEKLICGTSQGRKKLSYVVNMAYDMFVPPWMRIFITKEKFKSTVQGWFDEIKNLLKYTPTEEQCVSTTEPMAQELEGADQC